MSSNRFRVLWLQSGGCGGCSMSLLNAESPDLYQTLELAGIETPWPMEPPRHHHSQH